MEAITEKPHGNLGNRNRMTHGIRGWLTIGSLPKGASYVRRIVGEFRRQIESGVLTVSGELTPYASALCQSATRHEARALLAGRWMRQQGEGLPLSDRLALLKAIADATDARDRCLEKLGLNAMPKESDPWKMLRTPQANGHAGHTEAITEQQP